MDTKKKIGAQLWAKVSEKIIRSREPRSVDDNVDVNSSDWATSMATNVVDAFKMPVFRTPTKAKENITKNMHIMMSGPSNTVDRFEEKDNNEPLPFRPKADFNMKDIVNAEYFKDEYDARTFVDKIQSRSDVKSESGDDIEFDPKPFLSAFEFVTEELLKIKRKVKKKIEDQEDAFNATELSRREKLEDIRKKFDGLKLSFYDIEKQLSSVAKTAIQIGTSVILNLKGDQLETIDLQRSRAADARELIQFFAEFKQGNSQRLDELKSSGIEGERKSATTARRLMNLSKGMDILGMDEAKANVEKYCEAYETEFLSKFDEARSENDYEKMNRYANVLFDFNGGNSCIQIYLNQNDFFIQRVMEDMAETADDSAAIHKDPNVVPECILKLYGDIKKCFESEWDIISLVFPNPLNVMQQLIQRIFAQSVQISLETIIENSKKQSNLDYLITLKTLHSETKSLVAALNRFDEEVIAKKTKKPLLTFVLNHSFEDLFIPYLEGDRYIKIEHNQMAESFQNILAPFLELYKNHSKIYRRNKNGAVTFISTREALANLSVNEMINLINPPDANANSPTANLPMEINSMVKMLQLHFDAVNRCKELCDPSLIARQVGSLFILLVTTSGSQYLNAILDMIMDELETSDPKAEPNFRFFPIVKIINHAATLMQVHVQHCVVPVISHSKSVLREILFYKNDFITSIESKLNAILGKTIIVVTNKLELLLSKQKKSDFKPKEELHNLEVNFTPTCLSIVEFIETLKMLIESSFDEENRDVFLSEIGTNLCRLLLDHFQKFPTNQVGAVVITKDIQKYNESISLLGISSLIERFELLREIGSLFIVKPENMSSITEDGILSKLEFRYLKPYLQMRWDWAKISKVIEDKS